LSDNEFKDVKIFLRVGLSFLSCSIKDIL